MLPAAANSHPTAVAAETPHQRASHATSLQFPHPAQDSFHPPKDRAATADSAPLFLIVLRMFFCPLNMNFAIASRSESELLSVASYIKRCLPSCREVCAGPFRVDDPIPAWSPVSRTTSRISSPRSPGVTSVGFAAALPMEGIKPFWSLIQHRAAR
jgi:hypothetical protein